MNKHLIKLLFCIFLCCVLNSCYHTEFPDDPYQTITGIWETYLNRTYYTADNVPLGSNASLMYKPKDLPKAYYEFSKDKTYIEYNQNGEITVYGGTYSIEHKTLTLRWEDKHSVQYIIASFSQNRLWIKVTYQSGDLDGKNLEQHHEIILTKL